MQNISSTDAGYRLAVGVKDEDKSRENLILELEQLRRTVGRLEMLSVGRNQVEKALRESEKRFRTFTENAMDAITVLNADGMPIYSTQSAPRMLGFETNSSSGGNYSELVHPDDLPNVMDALAQVSAIPYRSLQLEARVRHEDGSWRTLEIIARNLLDDPVVKGIVVNQRDITERKQAEENLQKRNEVLAFLNTIAETANRAHSLDDMLNNVLDRTLQILDIKHGAVHLLDKETGILTMLVYRGVDDEEIHMFSPLKIGEGSIGRVAQSGEAIWFESIPDSIHLFREDVRDNLIKKGLKSAICIPLKIRGEVLGLMSAATEGERLFTTEEKELLLTIGSQISTAIENIQLLEEASRVRALEELDRLRTEILASVSHELRTPLTAIKGLADSLVQPDIEWDKETEQDFLHTINHESDVLTHIVDNLMQMSQMEAGIMQIVKRRSTIYEIVSPLESTLEEITRGHQFKENIKDGLDDVNAADMRIGQVITNLVSNAASYSEKGSRITLSAKALDGQIVVSVEDEGIGIPRKHIGKVFDRFYRLDSGIALRRGGTGLGLAICKGIVEEHEGLIWVESKVGKGSKFSFSLPVVKEPEVILPD